MKPPEWKVRFGGTNPEEWSPMAMKCQVKTGKGGDENSSATQEADNARPKHGASREYGKPGSVTPPGSQAIGSAEEASDRVQPDI